MAYDLVTWAPAVGSTGDDKYNVPGATKIDGSVDASGPSRVSVGTSSFSPTPSIGEINAASDLNQVIALYNRRVNQYLAAFGGVLSGTTPTTQAYFSSDFKIGSAAVQSFQSKINTLRAAEGFASYSFPAHASGTKMRGSVLAHLRKSLAIAGTLTVEVNSSFASGEYAVWKKDNNSPFSESLVGRVNTTSDYVGYRSSVTLERGRLMLSFRIPTWMTDTTKISSAVLNFNVQATGVVGSPVVEAYISNTDEVPYSSVAQVLNTNNSLGNLSPVVGVNTFTISTFNLLTNQAGGWVSAILRTTQEAAGLTTNTYAVFPTFAGLGPRPNIVVDFN